MIRRQVILLTVALISFSAAHAQEGGEKGQADVDLRKTLREMEERHADEVEDLRQRIDDLEEEMDEAREPPEQRRSRVLNLFNPRITVFGNFVGRLDDKEVRTEDGDRIDNRFNLREVEIDFRASIDPWADGVVIAAFESEVPNEYEAGIEEGYLTLKRLPILETSPWGLKLKAGRFKGEFGRINRIHTHDLPWVTRPLSFQQFLGDHGYTSNGVSAQFFVPTPGEGNSLEATAQILGGGEIGVAEEYEGADPSGVGRLAWFFDLGLGHDIEVGGSAFYGKHIEEVIVAPGPPPVIDTAHNLTAQLYGIDFTYKWKPFEAGEWRSFLVGGEAYYADLDQPTGPDSHPKGFFLWTQVQFNRSLYLGLRYDFTEAIEDPDDETQSIGVFLSYYTTEFLRFRVGYEHFKSDIDDLDDLDSAYLEFNFVIGSHPVEPYWVNR